MSAIEARRDPDAARLLFGLGIRHIGVVTARDLLKRYVTLPAIAALADELIALREATQPIYFGGILGISWPILVFLLMAVLGEVVMRRTAFGRYCAAIGSNDQVARYSSVDVNRVRLLTYVGLGLLVGIATILYVPRLGSASSSTAGIWKYSSAIAVCTSVLIR